MNVDHPGKPAVWPGKAGYFSLSGMTDALERAHDADSSMVEHSPAQPESYARRVTALKRHHVNHR
jgi:hypothetical protein